MVRYMFVLVVVMTGVVSVKAQLFVDGVSVTVLAGTSVYLDQLDFQNQTNVSDGNIDNDGDIYVDGNWTNNATGGGQVFINTDGTGTVHFTNTVLQTIGGTETTTFENMAVNNTGVGLQLGNSITVLTSLTLTSGNINTTSTELLIINDNATSTAGSSSSFVDGPMKKIGNDAFTFPVGDGTVWARLGISAPTLVSTEYTAQYFDASHPDLSVTGGLNNVSSIEYWTLDQAINDDDVQITLFWEDATRSAINAFTTDLRVARYNGVDWEDVGHSSITASDPGDVTSPVAPDYSPFTFGSLSTGSNPLPIELLYFTGKLQKEGVLLSWETASEKNNDYFELRHSIDAENFRTLSITRGQGTSEGNAKYDYLHSYPHAGINYYRLKQVDFDGTFTYSGIISVKVDAKEVPFSARVYPNPVVNGKFNLVGNLKSLEKSVDIRIINSFGQNVIFHRIQPDNLRFFREFDINLQSGVYFIELRQGEYKTVSRIIIY